MKEIRDPEVRLFGMNIAFQVVSRRESESESESIDCADVVSGEDNWLEDQRVNRVEGEEEEEAMKDSEIGNSPENPLNSEPSTNPETVSEPRESPGTPSVDEETENDANNSQQKTLKKPDKILPCPRCKSMDTKFCYYNNYNVNQPRHFCKSCQRYWTSGGSMRNVAVGAGRRKNKNSASHCRLSGTHHSGFGTNGQILSFGSDARLCESMASANGIHHRHENGRPVACNGGENGDDCSSKSSVTTSNSTEEVVKSGNQDPTMANSGGFCPQIQYLQGVPWPWNSTIPMPTFCPQGFPMSFYPPPYWNCNVQATWSTVPWLSLNKECGSNFSTNLGKRSREGDLLNAMNPEEKDSVEGKSSEGSILVPKTLRFDDPIDAAKSSIWTTLGIKNESTNNGGIFRAFQAKGNEKIQMVGPSPVLLANPAAFSRSVCFRESS